MTREEAKKELAATWTFERVGETILLRDVSLIEAVLSREAEHSSHTSPIPSFASTHLSRPA